jgi:Protein of unknown function (DUF3828)
MADAGAAERGGLSSPPDLGPLQATLGGEMTTRYTCLVTVVLCAASWLAVLALSAVPARAESPDAMITAIYQRAAAGNGDLGGYFLVEPEDRAPYFTKSLAALWTAAEARTQPGYAGPLDFDPVSSSQDPQIRAFAVKTERDDGQRATVAVTFGPKKAPLDSQPTTTVRYDLVNEAGAWKIDDIRGAASGGAAWSMRWLLTNFNR